MDSYSFLFVEKCPYERNGFSLLTAIIGILSEDARSSHIGDRRYLIYEIPDAA